MQRKDWLGKFLESKSVKKKIEIKWSDILAIRAKIMEDGTGVLEIEVSFSFLIS